MSIKKGLSVKGLSNNVMDKIIKYLEEAVERTGEKEEGSVCIYRATVEHLDNDMEELIGGSITKVLRCAGLNEEQVKGEHYRQVYMMEDDRGNVCCGEILININKSNYAVVMLTHAEVVKGSAILDKEHFESVVAYTVIMNRKIGNVCCGVIETYK